MNRKLGLKLLHYWKKSTVTVLQERHLKSKSWINNWAKRYKQSPNETLRNRYHSGRKSVLTVAARKLIKQSKYRRGQSLRKLERRLKDKRRAGSKETIRRYMQTTLKWKSFKRRKVPKLSDTYKVRRVNFAKKFKDLDYVMSVIYVQ